MKKLTFCILTAFLLLSFIPTQLKANMDSNPASIAATNNVTSSNANAGLARLDEINAMDRSDLNRSEKRELRKEVRTIKGDQDVRIRRNSYRHDRGNYEGRHGGGTVYFMGGGGVLLIILLIILLM
jgi:hypothetical protein